MEQKNLADSPTMLRVDDQVQDGRATATVKRVDRGRNRGAEYLLEYDDGATLWVADNRFVRYEDETTWKVV